MMPPGSLMAAQREARRAAAAAASYGFVRSPYIVQHTLIPGMDMTPGLACRLVTGQPSSAG